MSLNWKYQRRLMFHHNYAIYISLHKIHAQMIQIMPLEISISYFASLLGCKITNVEACKFVCRSCRKGNDQFFNRDNYHH